MRPMTCYTYTFTTFHPLDPGALADTTRGMP